MNARVVVLTVLLDPDKDQELCAMPEQALEHWFRKAYIDLSSEAAAPQIYFHASSVSIVDVPTNPYHY